MPASFRAWPFKSPIITLQRRYSATWINESVWADPAEASEHAQHHNFGEQDLDWRIVQVPAAGVLLNLIEGRIV